MKRVPLLIFFCILSAVGLAIGWRAPAALAAGEFIITVKTDNPGVTDNKSFQIPRANGYSYNYNVNWGDGSNTVGTTTDATHTYASSGTYQIKITGTFPAIKFNFGGDKDKLLSIDQWGNNNWQELAGAFAGCSHLHIAATDAPDLTTAVDLTYSFRGTGLTNENLNSWDVRNVRFFIGTFQDTQFNGDITDWDPHAAESLFAMFYNDTAFNQDVSNWTVASVTNLSSMFAYDTAFNNGGVPLDWGTLTGSVQNMSTMFYHASSFNQNVSNWNVSNVTNMNSMFEGASAFNNGEATNGHSRPMDWSHQTSKVTNMQGMFTNAASFNQDISSWDTSSVTTMAFMWSGATLFNQDVSPWDVSDVTTLDGAFNGTALSTRNYDALLFAWSREAVQPSVLLGANNATYCDATQRNVLTSAPHSWTITDSGLSCPAQPTVSFAGATPAANATLIDHSFDVVLSASSVGERYAFLDLDRSVLGWWRFEGGATDSSSQAQSGSWDGIEAYALGRFGYAGKFDGATSFDVTLNHPPTASFTVSAWVRPNSLTGGAAVVGDSHGHLIQIGGSDRWQFDDTYSASAVASVGTWDHVVGVYDAAAGTETLYVNGTAVSSSTAARSISSTLYIGKRDDNIYVDGAIDEVLLFGRALTASEVLALYDSRANEYEESFSNLSSDKHYFEGRVVDDFGRAVSTGERQVNGGVTADPSSGVREGGGATLKRRVANLERLGQGPAAAALLTQWTGTSAPIPTRDLWLGTSGPDVRALQQFLNSHGFAITAAGPGSAGQETDFFGLLTKAALIRFQTASHITPAVGFCGPITRAAINQR